VKDNFSPTAARASDLLLALELVTPLALQAGEGLDAAAGRRSLVYGETIAVSLALNAATKVLVARPRPYLYNPDPRVQAYARRQGRDAHLSFYSGHAATAFAAAVGGGYLFAQSTTDTRARTAAWAAGLMLAGATSNLRVRAGKHFYSDVLVGAALGAGAGLAVPLLHYRGHETNALTSPEWLAIAVAPLAGAALSQIVPLPAAFGESPSPSAHTSPPAVVVPWVSGSGGGLALAGRF
jgi:membrane-associated phospholipid phosphatase